MHSWWAKHQSHKSLNSFTDKTINLWPQEQTIGRQNETSFFCVCAPIACNCWWVAVKNLYALKVLCRGPLFLFLHRFLVWHLANSLFYTQDFLQMQLNTVSVVLGWLMWVKYDPYHTPFYYKHFSPPLECRVEISKVQPKGTRNMKIWKRQSGII